MADPSDPSGVNAGRTSPPGMPRWVKVFGIGALVLFVLVTLLLTGVFGEGHGPGRHTGGARSDTSSGDETTGGVGMPAAEAEATRTIEIRTLDTFAFEPGTITVSAGEVIAFVVTNSGRVAHEFTIGDAAMQQQHAQAMAHIPEGVGHGFPNSIMVQPGETKLLTWRFGEAPAVEFACHVRGHYEAGMRGRIMIT